MKDQDIKNFKDLLEGIAIEISSLRQELRETNKILGARNGDRHIILD